MDSTSEQIGAAISRKVSRWARLVGGAAILAVLVERLGAGPFLDGFRMTSAGSLAAALGITVLTTACCAWRWRLVAVRLGVDLPVGTAFSAYYRSQFLNATLPGGVLGDVHRAVRHGRDVGDLGGSLRSVAWERSLGQAVQTALTVIVLLLMPSPLRSQGAAVGAAAMVLGLGAVLAWSARPRGAHGLPARVGRAVTADLRKLLLVRRAWLGIVIASGLAAAGHVLVFLIAARTSGVDTSAARLLPLALVVLLASAIPMNIAGWGPREATAAWAFHATGLTADQGVTVAVVYGVMALVATLPGALVLLLRRRDVRAPAVPGPTAGQRLEGATYG